MNTKYALLSLAVSLLTACTGPAVRNDKAEPPASYQEKIHVIRLNQLKTEVTCPKDVPGAGVSLDRQVQLANACVKQKDFATLERLANHLAIADVRAPWGAYFLSIAAASRHDLPRAQWMLDLALKKAPREGLLHYQLARLEWQQGFDADAVKEMKLASDLQPSLFDAHFTMGELALQNGDLPEARKYLTKAVAADPDHLGALLARAALELRAKDFNSAEQVLVQAVSHHPQSLKARLALAEVQEQHLRKNVEALSNYKQLKQMSGTLDGSVPPNIDARIQALEKSLSQAGAPHAEGSRQPSGATEVIK